MRMVMTTAVMAGAAVLAMAGTAFGQDLTGGPPSPEDVPTARPVAVGLAGAPTPDLVRYLMVRGAVGARLSPDGRSLAYLSNVTGEPQIWIVPAVGGAPKQLTFGSTVNSVNWTPDGSALLYAADTAGDEQQGFYLLSPDGLHERVLIPKAEAYRQFGGFSSDGRRFIYSSTERNGRDFDVYVGDVATGQTRLVHQGSFGVYVAAWQPDGDLVVLSETRGEDGADLSLLNLATGEVRSLIKPDVPSANEEVVFTPDGKGFYLITNVDRDFRAIGHYDLASGELKIVEQDDHELEQMTLSKDGRWLGWTSNEDGFDSLHVRDLSTGRDVAIPDLPHGNLGLAFADDAPVAMVNVSASDAVAEPMVWNLMDGSISRPVRTNWAGLDPATMSKPEAVRFTGRDGTALSGLLYLPAPAADGSKPPLILRLHGGPSSQARPGWNGSTQYLVARGMAVLDFNYRGSTGFGKAFAMLNDKRLRPNELGDLEDAVAYVRGTGQVDADRVAVMGGSYGGYLTNAAVGTYPKLFDAGVSMVGVMNWVSALEGASPALKASDRVEYGDIDNPADRAFFASISPINNIDRVRTPLVVVHGANDPRDPTTESDMLVRGVRANGVDVLYLRFADEGHGVSKVANQVHMWNAIGDFLTRRFGMTD